MNDCASCQPRNSPMPISTTPVHLPTVPSCKINKIPTTIPNTVQLTQRLRVTSSSISSGPDPRGVSVGCFASAVGASPAVRELGDSGLDLGKGDMGKLASP